MNELKKEIITIIPTFFDSGIPFARFVTCLESIQMQTLKPKKIIITDDSVDSSFITKVKKTLNDYEIPIEYIKNPNDRGMGSNSNNGLNRATSGFVHILHSDDCLNDINAYEKMVNAVIENDSGWVFVGGKAGKTLQRPTLNDFLIYGINTLGGPSGMFALRDHYLNYDTELKMLVDVEQYVRMIKRFGTPGIINEPLIDYGVGPWQVQNNMRSSVMIFEYKYILEKYPESERILNLLEETSKDLQLQIRLKLLDLLFLKRKNRYSILSDLGILFFKRGIKRLKRIQYG